MTAAFVLFLEMPPRHFLRLKLSFPDAVERRGEGGLKVGGAQEVVARGVDGGEGGWGADGGEGDGGVGDKAVS